jgi:hypothetical protein
MTSLRQLQMIGHDCNLKAELFLVIPAFQDTSVNALETIYKLSLTYLSYLCNYCM